MLVEKNWRLGAENSGHVLLLDKTTTGDGIVAGLQVLAAMVRNNMSLADLCSGMTMLPQILINVRFSGKDDPLTNPEVKSAIEQAEQQLVNNGRVLIRKSGTEPLIRVMVEGSNQSQVQQLAEQIANAVKQSN